MSGYFSATEREDVCETEEEAGGRGGGRPPARGGRADPPLRQQGVHRLRGRLRGRLCELLLAFSLVSLTAYAAIQTTVLSLVYEFDTYCGGFVMDH